MTMTGDDAFEADYGTRNLAFYDNYITNSATLLLARSALGRAALLLPKRRRSTPLRGPFKLNNTNSGFLVYNNTIVRTEGRPSWGWVQFNNGALRSWSYRNNILIYRGRRRPAGNGVQRQRSDRLHPQRLVPGRAVWWTKTGGSFDSMAAARAGLPATTPLFGTATVAPRGRRDHGERSVRLADHARRGSPDRGHDDRRPGAQPRRQPEERRGIEMPNVTDGYAGAAPDMGAIIEGRPPVRWGAVRP